MEEKKIEVKDKRIKMDIEEPKEEIQEGEVLLNGDIAVPWIFKTKKLLLDSMTYCASNKKLWDQMERAIEEIGEYNTWEYKKKTQDQKLPPHWYHKPETKE